MELIGKRRRAGGPVWQSAVCGIALALVAALLSGGCATATLGGVSGASKPEKSTTIESLRVDQVSPVVKRRNAATAEISFVVDGEVNYVDTVTTRMEKHDSDRIAFGFFPATAPVESPADKAGMALKALWYNVCFFGVPTISGLFVAPFVESSPNSGSTFSRAALFGFYRWHENGRWIAPKVDRTTRAKTHFPLENVSMSAEGFASRMENGKLVVGGLSSGEQKVPVWITVPEEHELKQALKGYERKARTVIVPEEAN